MNKDISLDRTGHLLGRNGFPGSYLNSKVFPLPWSFAADLSLGARLFLFLSLLLFLMSLSGL